jgi:hypothetical protein
MAYMLIPAQTNKQYIIYRIGDDINLQKQTAVKSDSIIRNIIMTFNIYESSVICSCMIETFIQIVKQIDKYNHDDPYYVYMFKKIKISNNNINNMTLHDYIKKYRFKITFSI